MACTLYNEAEASTVRKHKQDESIQHIQASLYTLESQEAFLKCNDTP